MHGTSEYQTRWGHDDVAYGEALSAVPDRRLSPGESIAIIIALNGLIWSVILVVLRLI